MKGGQHTTVQDRVKPASCRCNSRHAGTHTQPTSCPWLSQAAKRLGGHTNTHMRTCNTPGEEQRGACLIRGAVTIASLVSRLVRNCHSGMVPQPNSQSWVVADATNTPLWQALKAYSRCCALRATSNPRAKASQPNNGLQPRLSRPQCRSTRCLPDTPQQLLPASPKLHLPPSVRVPLTPSKQSKAIANAAVFPASSKKATTNGVCRGDCFLAAKQPSKESSYHTTASAGLLISAGLTMDQCAVQHLSAPSAACVCVSL